MILLDTIVLSELMRPANEPAVERWLAGQPDASVFISAITEAELRHGVALLAAGRRGSMLAATIDAMLREDFGGRILPFDSPAAGAFAEIAAMRRQAGLYRRRTRRLRPSHGLAVRCLPPAMRPISKDAALRLLILGVTLRHKPWNGWLGAQGIIFHDARSGEHSKDVMGSACPSYSLPTDTVRD